MTDTNLSTQIRERIRAARRAAGLSQADLAAALGCTQSTISGIERGRVQVGARALARLAEVLGQPISYFFPEAEIADLSDLERRLIGEFRQLPAEWQGVVMDQVGAQARLYRLTEARMRQSAGDAALAADAPSAGQADEARLLAALDAQANAAAEVLNAWPVEATAGTPAPEPAPVVPETRVRPWEPAPLAEPATAAPDELAADTTFRPFSEAGVTFPQASLEEVVGDRSADEEARLRLLDLIRDKTALLDGRRPRRRPRPA